MYQQIRPGGFNILPPVVKNLMIINAIMFFGTVIIQNRFGIDLRDYLGLHWFRSELFQPYQLVTHMFMHADLSHIFSNMFALWMFGNILENLWGGKKFLIYYLITALGAAIIHNLSISYDVYHQSMNMDPELVNTVWQEGWKLIKEGKNYADVSLGTLNATINGATVGASGAVFGVLLAFGMLFPNSEVYVFFAIPVKAKYFVAIYGIIELSLGFGRIQGDNIAHFAHLGGMLFGYLMIKYWNRHNRQKRNWI